MTALAHHPDAPPPRRDTLGANEAAEIEQVERLIAKLDLELVGVPGPADAVMM